MLKTKLVKQLKQIRQNENFVSLQDKHLSRCKKLIIRKLNQNKTIRQKILLFSGLEKMSKSSPPPNCDNYYSEKDGYRLDGNKGLNRVTQ